MKKREENLPSPFTFVKDSHPTRTHKINRLSALASILLSLIALVTVLTGYFQPPRPDEGSAAHIFQLSIVALFPTLIAFLFTADWKKPWRSARPLIFSAATLIVAFAALFYLEHYR
jgi:heme/copper-type cytochrome/quinol oxidase subunit 4